ncbi:PLP-dependent transferase [Schizophyllum commune Loenen D]|nr:PLP-dependent transferase [Schizophyllum commune Loenen D]
MSLWDKFLADHAPFTSSQRRLHRGQRPPASDDDASSKSPKGDMPGAPSQPPFAILILKDARTPKALELPTITSIRPVAALCEWPALEELAPNAFPKDVIARARELREEIGSVGAYSHNQSIGNIIEERDGYPTNLNHIFLTSGASAGVSLLISMLITPLNTGILLPLPRYPLSTATFAQHHGVPLPYHLDEASGWATSLHEIEATLEHPQHAAITPKALVIINRGNLTGALFNEATQEKLVHLCEKHNLVLLADEVYQTSLHRPDEYPFVFFKQIVPRMKSKVPLVSFHSISKARR